MTTENQQMLAQLQALHDAYHGKMAGIDARLNSAASRWEDFETIFNVDQSMGDDANDGTQASPIATIQEAINRAPFLGRCVVLVRGAYVSDQRLENYGRYVRIAGAQADWTVDFANHIDFTLGTAVAGNLIHTLGFSMGWDGAWEIYGCALKTKTLAQVTADHPGASVNGNSSAIFIRPDTGRGSGGTAHLRWSTIDITADPYGWVLGSFGLLGLQVGADDGCGLDTSAIPIFPPLPGDLDQWGEILDRSAELKPCLHGLADGLAFGMDRSAAAGNGVVPLAAAHAYCALRAELGQ